MGTKHWLKSFALGTALICASGASLHADTASLQNVSADLQDSRATVSIIIDDVGHNRRYGEQVAYLPAPLTLAILPHTPFDQHFADLGQTVGKEVMLHMPMQSISNRASSKHQLEVSMTKDAFMAQLLSNLDSFRGYTGINNHQGSRMMGNATRLEWMMDEIAGRNVFFVDSRTGVNSPANRIATRFGIATSNRDVFLDHMISEQSISKQFDRLISRALRDGHAVAIGHPHPQTIAVLKRRLPELAARGIAVVPVSTTIALQSGAKIYAAGDTSTVFRSSVRRSAAPTRSNSDPRLREISDTERYSTTQ